MFNSIIMSYLVIFSFVISLSFFIFFAFLLAFYHWRWPSTRKKYNNLPRPKMSKIFGIGLDLFQLRHSELMDYISNLIRKHGPVMYVEILGFPHVFLNNPEDVEMIFNSSQHITKGIEYTPVIPWLCEGLLTSTGSKWHMRRKMLTPTFHFKILENFIPIFNRNGKLLTKNLTATQTGPVDVDKFVSLCTLDIICETAMGTSLDFQMGEASEYVAAIRKAGEIVLRRNITFWMFNEFIFNISPVGREFYRNVKLLHSFTEKVIKERKEKYNPQHACQEETEIGKQKERKSFLDCLIEMQKENPTQMTDEGIREEVDTFMFEGHDTTSVALTWTLFMIALHDEVQEKLREELELIFGGSDRDATLHDLHQMSYLEKVIKESLRLYPSVPYISRALTTDLKLRDYLIPAGTNVSVSPYVVHRNPAIYPDPEKFDPERFQPHVAKERHPYAYIPFSAGYRNCIGQKFALLEEKVVISLILRKLKLSSKMKKDEVKGAPEMILRPHPKIMIKFTPLKKK